MLDYKVNLSISTNLSFLAPLLVLRVLTVIPSSVVAVMARELKAIAGYEEPVKTQEA